MLYAAMYAAYGVASPFFPAFLVERGLRAEELGIALGMATAVRLVVAPAAARAADAMRALRLVLAFSTGAAALATSALFFANGPAYLLAVVLLHAAFLAPMTVLADALALGAAARPGGFEYGWARGTGSAAFIAGTLLAGQAVAAAGLGAIVWLQASLLALVAAAALWVPELRHREKPARKHHTLELLKIPGYRNLVLCAALVLGSHAMHDAFAVIRWRAAGIGPGTASLLWSEAVAAEVVVFFLLGPRLLAWLTPAGALALAAAAGALRWAVMATSTELAVLALAQPLHGVTFALLHLACMRLIARLAPDGLEGTAQALYATLGVGGATALLTLLSGTLYARLDAHGFWVMAALSAAALPFAWKLRR